MGAQERRRLLVRTFGRDHRQQWGPWEPLRDELGKYFEFSDDASLPEAALVVDHQRTTVLPPIPARQRVLLRFEPPAVNPRQFTSRVASKYGMIYDSFPSAFGTDKWFTPPILRHKVGETCHEGGLDGIDAQCGLLAANKNSLVGSSRYRLRREFLTAAEKHGLKVLLGGPGWRDSRVQLAQRDAKAAVRSIRGKRVPRLNQLGQDFRPDGSVTYIGSPADTLSFHRRCKFIVVIENDEDVISERIFDAHAAGRVPIYVGHSLARVGLQGLAIEVEPHPSAIIDAVKNVDETTFEATRRYGQAWMRGNHAPLWTPRLSLGLIARRIADYLSEIQN